MNPRLARPTFQRGGGSGRGCHVAAGTATAVLAFVVRIWGLDALGFNSDEAVYAGQAASLAGNPNYVDLFPVFRAHPMLFQTILSVFFRVGEVDVAGRVVVALFWSGYRPGRLHARRAALQSAGRAGSGAAAGGHALPRDRDPAGGC